MKLNYTKHRLANLISINKIVTVHYYEFSKNFVHQKTLCKTQKDLKKLEIYQIEK